MLLAERVGEIAKRHGGEVALPLASAAGALNELSPEANGKQLIAVLGSPALGVTMGSIGTIENAGNAVKFADPRTYKLARDHYFNEATGEMVNSIGLRECGMKAAKPIIAEVASIAADWGKLFKVSVTSLGEEDPSVVDPQLAYEAFEAGAPFVEINLGCPNKVASSGKRHEITGRDVEATEAVLRDTVMAVGGNRGLGVKLSWYDPETIEGITDHHLLKDILGVVQQVPGIDFVTLTNTKPNVRLLLSDGTPALDRIPGHVGGGSGWALADESYNQLVVARAELPKKIDVISATGVWNGTEVRRRERAGAIFSEMVSRLWHDNELYGMPYPKVFKNVYHEYLRARELELA